MSPYITYIFDSSYHFVVVVFVFAHIHIYIYIYTYKIQTQIQIRTQPLQNDMKNQKYMLYTDRDRDYLFNTIKYRMELTTARYYLYNTIQIEK